MQKLNNLVVVRGGGDIATGVIQKIKRAGFDVVVLETDKPSSIRRKVCLSEAVYDNEMIVEDIKGVKANDINEIEEILNKNCVAILIDKKAESIKELKPIAVVDAILAKKNMGTSRAMADITIGLGPGFYAGKDVDIVVETMRGHNLGRLIFEGYAMPNTGIPGAIAGVTVNRVVYSKSSGVIKNISHIGDIVKAGDVIAKVSEIDVVTKIDGVLRGLIKDGFEVKEGLKIADIDPRVAQEQNCNTISDKARTIGGAVLEALMMSLNKK